jgi:pimeloyl-ACP methyl ester carboxylesterase
LAPDSFGAGKSPDWPSADRIRLQDEVEFLAPVLAEAGRPFSLVGHSYGAAVALMAALRDPSAIRALVLYEPTLFALVDAESPEPNDVDGIRHTVRRAVQALEEGDKHSAAGHFIDFWMGDGSWAMTPEVRQPAIADAVTKVRRWAHALFTEPTSLAEFARLDMPVLYLLGEASPKSAHAVAQRLVPVLPRVTLRRLPGLGHMAPVTHPEKVNAVIAEFLRGL